MKGQPFDPGPRAYNEDGTEIPITAAMAARIKRNPSTFRIVKGKMEELSEVAANPQDTAPRSE